MAIPERRAAMRKLAVGHHSEARHPAFGKAVLAELVLTFLFAFAGVGGCMAVEQLSVPSASATALIVASVTHAFIVFAVLSAGLNLSGAHFNPAVTFGLAAGGHVTLFRMIAYWIAQLVGSSLACLLLRYLTGGLDTPVHALAAGMPAMKGVIMEAVLTFGLLFVVYGTLVDPKKGEMSIVGPLSVGLVVGANILAGGSFSGASMNPARSFGPALATGVWTNHWVYWVGPLIGGGLAGLFYENVLVGQPTHLPLRDNDASY